MDFFGDLYYTFFPTISRFIQSIVCFANLTLGEFSRGILGESINIQYTNWISGDIQYFTWQNTLFGSDPLGITSQTITNIFLGPFQRVHLWLALPLLTAGVFVVMAIIRFIRQSVLI